jgi:hypothetical protein
MTILNILKKDDNLDYKNECRDITKINILRTKMESTVPKWEEKLKRNGNET